MVGAITAVLAAGTVAVVSQSPAEAHGAPLVPGSRNYLCWLDALTPQGNLNPTNQACRDALTQGGDQAYYNWFGSLRSDGAGRTRGFIPDSAICHGGNSVFAGMSVNSTSTAWPYTRLTAGSTIQVRYNKWAAHPGFFRLYVTRDGWQSGGLTWDDIEGIPQAGQPVRGNPFDEVQNPPDTGPVGSVNGYYYWNVTLPSNKSGRHIIYAVWHRTDSTETFYTCSDVSFDGGNGQVVGVGNPVPPPPPAPPAPNPPPPPPPGPQPPPPPPPGPQPPPPPGGCTATWAQASRWSNGYTGMVTVRNTGTSAINGWTVSLNVGSDTITNMWSGIRTGNTGAVSVRNESYNGSVPAGGSTSFGFQASGSGTPTVGCSTG
jgi:chitin-binding protein